MHNIVKSKVNWNDLGKFREKLGYATFRKNDFSKKIPFGDNQAKKREREREKITSIYGTTRRTIYECPDW